MGSLSAEAPRDQVPVDPGARTGWIAELRSPRVVSTSLPEEVARRAVATLGQQTLGWVSEVSQSLVERLVSRDASLIRFRSDLSVAVELVTVETVARLAGAGFGQLTRSPMLTTIDRARSRAVSYPSAIAAVNLIQFRLVEELMDASAGRESESAGPADLRAITDVVMTVCDTLITDMAQSYSHDEALPQRRESRLDAVAALIDGRISPARFERTTGYWLDRVHVAVVAVAKPFESAAEPKKLERETLRTLDSLGCDTRFHVFAAPNVVWAWGTVPSVDSITAAMPDPCPGASVVVGLPGRGLTGFIASHREAVSMHRLVGLAGWRNLGRTLTYKQLGPVAEMSAEPERLRRFIDTQLGALSNESVRQGELRKTVLEYLNVNRSQGETARRLHVSKNTVSYRLHRAEMLLGRDLGTDLNPLHVALLASDVLGGTMAAPLSTSVA